MAKSPSKPAKRYASSAMTITMEYASDRDETGALTRKYVVRNHRAGLMVTVMLLGEEGYYPSGDFVIARYDLVKAAKMQKAKSSAWVVMWAPGGRLTSHVTEPHLLTGLLSVRKSLGTMLKKMTMKPSLAA